MRILSPHSGYSVQVIAGEERVEHDRVTGQAYTNTVTQPFIAHFEASATGGGLFPHEAELALRLFSFKGTPEGVNPLHNIAVFDTEAAALANNWTPEYKDAIEKRIRYLADLAPTRMVVAEELRAPKPWPKYDEHDSEEIVAYMGVLGIDPEIVATYERDQETPNVAVLTALEALKDGQTPEVEAVATVSG